MCFEWIRNVIRIPLVFLLFISLAEGQEAVSNIIELDIKSQPLAKAIKIVANEFDLQIAFYSEVTDGIESPRLAGTYTANQALGTLLEGTSLEFIYVDDQAVAITAKNTGGGKEAGKSRPASKQILVAQAETPAQQTRTTASSTDRGARKTEAGRNTIEEVIVTARKREE